MKFICTLFDERDEELNTITYHLIAQNEEAAKRAFLAQLPEYYEADEIDCISEEQAEGPSADRLNSYFMSEFVHWTEGFWKTGSCFEGDRFGSYNVKKVHPHTIRTFRQNMAVLQGDTPEIDPEYGHLFVTEPHLTVNREFCQKNVEKLIKIYLSFRDWQRSPRPLFPWER